jgi:hypothetical protein
MDLKKDNSNQRSDESQNENKSGDMESKLFIQREESYEDEEILKPGEHIRERRRIKFY